MLIFTPVLIFILLNSICVFFSKRSFGFCMPVTLLLSALILYFCQFAFGSFKPGYVLILVCLLCSAALIVLKRKDAGFLELYLSNGFWAFIVLGVIFFIADYNRHFSYWDELSHWGKMIKEMMRLDAFYSVPESNLLPHKEYPPLISLFEMLWCQLSGGFSESGSTLALHIFEFSMIVPLLTDRSNSSESKLTKKWGIGVCFFFFFYMLASFCDTGGFLSTIYTDYSLPFVYVFAIAIILDDDTIKSSFGVFAVLLALFSLILIKQIGIAFVLLIWLFLSLRTKKALLSVSALAVPAASYIIWTRYTSMLGLEGQFDFSRISLGNISAIVLGNSDKFRVEYTTSKLFLKALFEKPVTAGLINFPFAGASLLCLLIIMLLFLFRRDYFKNRGFSPLVILYICGIIGYTALLFVMYMFCFREVEMLGLFSFERYFGSFVFGELAILAVLVLYMCSAEDNSRLTNSKMLIAISIVSILLFNPSRLKGLFPQVLLYGNPNYTYEERADKIQELTFPQSKLLICSSNDEMNVFYLGYYLENLSLDTKFMYSDIQDIDENNKIWDDYVDEIKTCDYYYVYDVPDNIDSRIGKYTNSGKLENNTVYIIRALGDDLSLIKVGD